jgi:hypothetical protein
VIPLRKASKFTLYLTYNSPPPSLPSGIESRPVRPLSTPRRTPSLPLQTKPPSCYAVVLKTSRRPYRLGAGPLLSDCNAPPPPVIGVILPLPAGVAGAGVGARLGTLLLLCAMCALTRCPAHNALLSDSSPASTPAAMTLASCLALSPGDVGCAPRTPSRSSIADWGSRIVPPPMVPTSIEGMLTLIWRLPLTLSFC